MTTPKPPPASIEALRERLAADWREKFRCSMNEDQIDFNDIETTYIVAWDAALQHLAEAAGREFDEQACHDKNTTIKDGIRWMRDETPDFIRGARWQWQRDFARIQELEAEVGRLRETLSGFVRYLSTGRFRSATFDRLLKEAREALSGGGE